MFARQSKELQYTRIYPCQHSDRLGSLVRLGPRRTSGRCSEKKGGFRLLLLSASLVLATGAAYAGGWHCTVGCRWAEATGNSEYNTTRWLLHGYDGTSERHVSDNLSPTTSWDSPARPESESLASLL